MNTYKKGKIAEEKAASFLQKKGYKIVEKNFYCKGGEIDIIAYKEGVFHFVEVKSGENFDPIYNITNKKISNITKCIYGYLKKHKIKSPFCISVIVIKKDSLDFIKNVTMY